MLTLDGIDNKGKTLLLLSGHLDLAWATRCAQLRFIEFLKRSFPRNSPRDTVPAQNGGRMDTKKNLANE